MRCITTTAEWRRAAAGSGGTQLMLLLCAGSGVLLELVLFGEGIDVAHQAGVGCEAVERRVRLRHPTHETRQRHRRVRPRVHPGCIHVTDVDLRNTSNTTPSGTAAAA